MVLIHKTLCGYAKTTVMTTNSDGTHLRPVLHYSWSSDFQAGPMRTNMRLLLSVLRFLPWMAVLTRHTLSSCSTSASGSEMPRYAALTHAFQTALPSAVTFVCTSCWKVSHAANKQQSRAASNQHCH
jgi:hypothetical protein